MSTSSQSSSPFADNPAGEQEQPAPKAAAPQRIKPQAASKAKAAPAAQPEPEAGDDAPRASAPRPRFGERRKRLELQSTRPGFVARWINDEPGRIAFAQECGYEFIKDDKGKPRVNVVDRRSGLKAYAMEIPKDLFEASRAVQRQRNDEVDDAILNRPQTEKGYRPGTAGHQSSLSPTRVTVTRGREPAAQE